MRARHLCGYAVAVFLAASSITAATEDTRLVESIKNKDMSTARSLLDHRGQSAVNTKDAEGMTSLMWAAHWDDIGMVKLLIGAGADVKAADRFGSTALHEAATFGDAAMIEILLKAGADPNVARAEGDSPLMVATRAGIPSAVDCLLAHGADPNAREGWYGETPLMIAVSQGYSGVAKVLIDHKADVNAVSTVFPYQHRRQVDATFTIDPSLGGLTSLHFAARRNDIESAKLLITAGADLNKVDPDYHYTPLMLAIVNDNFALASLLVESGADVKKDGYLVAVTQMRNRPAVVDANDGHFTIVPPAGSLELMKLLIEHGADINATFTKQLPYKRVRANRDANPFFVAAEYIDIPAMQLLKEKGAHITPMKDGTNPLMAVMMFDDTDRPTADVLYQQAIQLCLDSGIDVNAANAAGNTALHYAAGSQHDASLQYLVEHGADLNAKTKVGRTPLDWAQGKRPGYGDYGKGGGSYGDAEREGLPHYPTTIALIEKLMNKTSADAR